MKLVILLFKATRKLIELMKIGFYKPVTLLIFKLNGVHLQPGLNVKGLVKILVTRRGYFSIGKNLSINSGESFNIIGRQQKTIFWVEGKLTIGNQVGLSSTALICNHEITIGDHVIIGGNCVIYDTDFHSLDPELRKTRGKDRVNASFAPVKIKDNVFIGAHSTILKGVSIGENSVIGAGSVVTKEVPANQIWAGNPAVFIKHV